VRNVGKTSSNIPVNTGGKKNIVSNYLTLKKLAGQG